jgi:hypothetical protein
MLPLLLLQRTPPAQAHRPVARIQLRLQEQAQGPNPNHLLRTGPSDHNGMVQIPKARLRPTSNPMAQRMPNVHCDTAPNPRRLRSEPTRGRTPDRRATYHDRRDLHSRSRQVKHIALRQIYLHAGRAPRPIPQSYQAEGAAARHNSLDPFPRRCIAARVRRYKPGHPQLLRPRRLRHTPCWCCHPRLHQHDISLAAELKKPDSEYQSRSFRYLPDAVRAGTPSLAPPESAPLDPSDSEKKRPSLLTGEAPRLPDAIHLVSPDLPTADLQS